MDAAKWVALAVAVVAALASVIAAVLSRRSAREAHRSADGIDRRRHMIEALDAETESFRDAVQAFYQSLHDMDPKQPGISRIRHLARAHMISAHTLCTPGLESALASGISHLTNAAKRDPADPEPGHISNVRTEVRKVFTEQARERRKLLEDIKAENPIPWAIRMPSFQFKKYFEEDGGE